MKKIVKRNQVIITALAIMIAVAGYLNFTGRDIPLSNIVDNGIESEVEETINENNAVLEISDEDMAQYQGAEGNSDEEIISAPVNDIIEPGTESGNIGESVLTSSNSVSNLVMEVKLNREQTRAKSNEILLDIINNENLDEETKAKAVDEMLLLTEKMENEGAAEQMLMAKGFSDVVVSITDNGVDVTVNKTELTDVEKAQIEDIVTRKTGCQLSEVVITTIKVEN